MSRKNFEIPVLVKYFDGKVYEISHLFTGFPKVSGRRYEEVLMDFNKVIRKKLGSTITNFDEINHLFWFQFNPELKLSHQLMSFNINRFHISERFTVIQFFISGHLLVLLPDFDDHIFIVNSEPDAKSTNEQIESRVKKLLQKTIENADEEFKPEDLKIPKKVFVTTIEISRRIENEMPDKEMQIFPSISLSHQREFNGKVEIEIVGECLNDLFPFALQRAYCVDDLVEKLANLLFGKPHAAIAIVGPGGCGKTSMIHEALRRYLKTMKDIGDTIKGKKLSKIYFFDPNRVISGMSVVGMWQQRMEAIIQYIIRIRKTTSEDADILYTDNPIGLFRIGCSSQNNMTLSNSLKPYIEKRQLNFIIEATPEEWRIVAESDRRFADLFQVIRINEYSFRQSADVAILKRIELEDDSETRFDHEALLKVFNMHRLYLRSEALPGSVIKQMQQMAVKFPQEITTRMVEEEFTSLTKMNQKLFEKQKISDRNLRHELQKKLIGQPQAIETLSNIIHLLNANLNDPQKPMVSALFIGPTGVGKTQAAKVLAEYLFDSSDSLVRFDMNEFIDGAAVSRLIGDFYNPEGQLTGRIRYNPFCVLLFDEIEKAHPDVLDLLLQVLGEGRLTDSIGRTVDFTNAIIILTSNLGAENAGRELGFVKNEQSLQQIYKKAVEGFFRPEMLNRIDEIVIFRRLKIDEIITISELVINDILRREGFARRTTILRVQQNALKAVAQRGFDPAMGARSLKRNLEKEIVELAADYLTGISPEVPILFELFLVKEKLKPRITPFEHAEKIEITQLPDFKNNGNRNEYLTHFHELLTTIGDEINDFRLENADVNGSETHSIIKNYELLILQEEVRNLREIIGERLLDIELSARFRTVQQTGFRKRKYHTNRDFRVFNIDKKILTDFYRQSEVEEYIREVGEANARTLDDSDAEMMTYFTRISWLLYFWEGYLDNYIDEVLIQIEPLKPAEGFHYDFMQLPFMKLWDEFPFKTEMNIPEKDTKQNHVGFIKMKGPDIYNILKHEEGLHIFTFKNNIYPVLVKVKRLEEASSDLQPGKVEMMNHENLINDLNLGNITLNEIPCISGKIIRFYDRQDNSEKSSVITDLRSGLKYRAETLQQRDAELLFSVHIPDSFKPFINNL